MPYAGLERNTDLSENSQYYRRTTMNKNELVKRVAKRADEYQKYTQGVLDALFEELSVAFERAESVTIPNFGRFEVVIGAPKKGYVDGPKSRGKLPTAMRVRFRPAPKLKERTG
jgi:DNA-binding protein HU-beta